MTCRPHRLARIGRIGVEMPRKRDPGASREKVVHGGVETGDDLRERPHSPGIARHG